MNKRFLIEIAFVLASSTVITLNSLLIKSSLIGVIAAPVFLVVSSVVVGRAFFSDEKHFSKITLGLLTFLVVTSLSGALLILTEKFTDTLSILSIVAISLLFWFVSIRRSSNVNAASNPKKEDKGSGINSYLILLSYSATTAVAFYLLLQGRTGEGGESVWLTIPSRFLPVFLFSSLFLFFTLFFTRLKASLKFALIVVHYFLARSLFLLVWYPGRYGDPWTHLGNERFIDNVGAPYAYDWLLKNLYIIDMIGSKAHYSLIIILKRLLVVDIYWVHVTFIPLIWSIFVPICSYEIARLLAVKKTTTFPLLATASPVLFPILIIWGAISVPNSLGFLFFFFSLVLGFHWLESGKKKYWFLSLAVSFAALLAHPLPGIFSFIFLAGATIISRKLPAFVKVVLYALLFPLYPLSLLLMQATFSLTGLINIENFLSFQREIFSPIFVFAFIGLLFSIRNKHVKRRGSALLFLFYLTILVGYFVTAFGMKNVPYGPDRLIPMANLLLVPLVAAGLLETASILTRALSHMRMFIQKEAKVGLTPLWASLLILSLFLASQATLALYQTYPQKELIPIQPAAYEIDAVYYINSTNVRYVVLCDTNFASIAIGFLGAPYGYGGGSQGMFGIPLWEWWTEKLYLQMVRSPSISLMEEALSRAGASASYFVVSVREPDFDDIVKRASEVMPVDKVFGDGKLYVFVYPSPITEENGPQVSVAFDNGAFTSIPTRLAYISKSEVNYTLTVSGHSSYNITNYPPNWAFQSLSVNGSSILPDQSSDVNSFVYVSGLNSSDVLTAMWQANDLYPVVGWKDDSLKSGWQTNPFYTGTITPDITVFSNVLSLSWNFVPGSYQYYYYIKNVAVSTNDYPYILVKWKSTGSVAVVGVAYASLEKIVYPVVPYNSESSGWTTSVVQLEPNKMTAYVMVGITNVGDQNMARLKTLYVDYIMISAKAQLP